MPRKPNPDLSKPWKVVLPATLAGSVEFELLDPVTKKPRYGERSRLIAALLNEWLASRGVSRIPLTPGELPSPDVYVPPVKEP